MLSAGSCCRHCSPLACDVVNSLPRSAPGTPIILAPQLQLSCAYVLVLTLINSYTLPLNRSPRSIYSSAITQASSH
eukprot:g12868.t1